jgi:DNA polymerase-3 subunit gamma/tau
MGATDTNRPATTISTNTTIAEKAETKKTLTNELIGKAWTSVALQLPENERALADRMKLIVPSLGTDNTFTISVDNQMVAELFEREAPRIIKGMRSDLGEVDIKMAVNVNKVVIERHVSDKGKQYEILKEKNPLIEKLRVELNLELAR